jgi:hypothetical protein
MIGGKMASPLDVRELEEQVLQLSPQEQLRIVARIADQLRVIPFETLPLVETEDEKMRKEREREVDELIALCNAAADMWESDFDVVEEIHRMREERDEQIWASKS